MPPRLCHAALLASFVTLATCHRASPPRANHGGDARVSTPPAALPATPTTRTSAWSTINAATWTPLSDGARLATTTLRLAPSPDDAHPDAAPMTLSWVVLRLEVARVVMRVQRTPDDTLGALWTRTPDALAVLDSGFFEPDHRPSGLVFTDGAALMPPGEHGGSGVLAVSDTRAALLPIDARDAGSFALPTGVVMAVQCGPRVVEAGAQPGIYRHDGRFAARTVACVREQGRVLDLIAAWSVDDARRGPELFDLAVMLAGASPVGDTVGCDAALNLDGGPSTGIYARDRHAHEHARHDAVGPTPWAIVVRARDG